MLKIYTLGEDVLRQKAEPVAEVNDEIRQLINDMYETMEAADGVGLAGPQVGRSLRLFVAKADDDVRRAFINPQLIATSEEIGDYDEGCLSLPQVYETIRRPVRVTVQALNEQGKPFTIEADGLLARIIQHEIDHLNGILFIDRGDENFAAKTKLQFEARAERAEKRDKAREAKARKIAAKKAAKEAKKAAQQ